MNHGATTMGGVFHFVTAARPSRPGTAPAGPAAAELEQYSLDYLVHARVLVVVEDPNLPPSGSSGLLGPPGSASEIFPPRPPSPDDRPPSSMAEGAPAGSSLPTTLTSSKIYH